MHARSRPPISQLQRSQECRHSLHSPHLLVTLTTPELHSTLPTLMLTYPKEMATLRDGTLAQTDTAATPEKNQTISDTYPIGHRQPRSTSPASTLL